MRVLVLNSGSSTLKFDLMTVDVTGSGASTISRLAHGLVDRIGRDHVTLEFNLISLSEEDAVDRGREEEQVSGGDRDRKWDLRATDVDVHDHRDAAVEVLKWLGTVRSGKRDGETLRAEIEAVGHRVVSGADRYKVPVLIDGPVLAVLDEITELAPLHNPQAVLCMRAVREVLGSSIPMVAVFDTAFHTTLPDYAYTYGLPRRLAQHYRIRRYGFHGTAHEYMLKRYSEMTGTPRDQATIITLQLGNGCSAAAIRNGRSVDTSMGFTPLEGLVMGTRSGDIDPGIVGYLAEHEGIDTAAVEVLLNRGSGLLGISGSSSDMRDLLAAEEQDAQAKLAVEVFCYRVRKYIGAYLAALGGAQAIVFGGGIGEHSPTVRARICEEMDWCGLRIDPERNEAMVGQEGRINSDDARIAVHVVSVDEALLIAQYTAKLVLSRR